MSERCPHLGHPDDPDEHAPICRECYDELRAACAAYQSVMEENGISLPIDPGRAFLAKHKRMEEGLTRVQCFLASMIPTTAQMPDFDAMAETVHAALQDTESDDG